MDGGGTRKEKKKVINRVDIEIKDGFGRLIVDGEDWSDKFSYFSVDMDAGDLPRLMVCAAFREGKIVIDGETVLMDLTSEEEEDGND